MSSPGLSWEKAIRPGPEACIMTSGNPARCLVQGLAMAMASTWTAGSCQSSTSWVK